MNSRFGHYKLDGKNVVPVNDIFEWAAWRENAQEDRIVAKTEFGDEATVSTVFLGVSHGLEEGKPVLFETMVFSHHDELDATTVRYTSWEEAEAGHELVRQGVYIWMSSRIPEAVEGLLS